MVTELSLDLIEEILLRFPAQSLAPWRYVCKQWKTLITDPGFVKKHLSHYRGHEQHFTIFNNVTDTIVPNNTSCKFLSSTVASLGIDYNELNNVPSLNMKVIKSWDTSVYHMSHCDGLLLLAMRFKLLVLNPLLKEARWIESDATSHDEMDVFGLGYKSSSSSCNDYKIVMFHSSSTLYEKDLKVYIYDFNSDRWKIIVYPTFDRYSRLPTSSMCLRGTPYWLFQDHNFKFSIQSFDFSKERFKPMCLPKEKIDYDSSLGIYRGDHLSLLYMDRSTYNIHIHIWVKKNLWSMLMKVDIPTFLMYHKLSSYSIEKNGKLVIYFSHTRKRYVTIYIVGDNNQERQKLEHNFCVDRFSNCYYVPSLVPVPRSLKVRRKRKRTNKLHS